MWTAATINFFIPKLSPRDPILEKLQQAAMGGGRQQSGLKEMVAAYEKAFGLDKPLWQQYVTYMGNMARLDFGYSLSGYPRKVIDVIGDAMPWTIGLALVSTLLSFGIGTILGALIAWPKAPRVLQYFMPPLIMLYALPGFLLAFVLIYFLAFRWRLLPLSGAYSRGAIPSYTPRFMLDLVRHATLPALALILTAMGGWALAMRGMMVSVQGEDYITYAEARGIRSTAHLYEICSAERAPAPNHRTGSESRLFDYSQHPRRGHLWLSWPRLGCVWRDSDPGLLPDLRRHHDHRPGDQPCYIALGPDLSAARSTHQI